MNIEEFKKEYYATFPSATLRDWLEDFANQLDCPRPEPTSNLEEHFKRIGAWETQMYILNKIRYAIKADKKVNKNE